MIQTLLFLASAIVMTPPTPCPTMTPANVFFVYASADASCSSYSAVPCTPGSPIAFSVQSFNYSFTCFGHTFLWNFGDGGTSSIPAVAHAYNAPGVYKVTLTITGSSGAVLTLAQDLYVGVSPPPLPRLSFTPRVDGYVVRCVIQADRQTKSTARWTIDFGDGMVWSSDLSEPPREIVHRYERVGSYRVVLSATGYPLSFTALVEVKAPARLRSVRH